MDRLNAALVDRYRIERELGAGGMATVYLAYDVRHDRKVAIKVLKPELAAVLGAERFVQEIKTTAALSHPHILPLFDSGTVHWSHPERARGAGDEGSSFLFYVMPFIEGETIREKLNRETQFGVDEAVRIAREVADALDYAHRHGVIHRDIKPENILLHDGRAMVMDFGIALAVSAAAGGRMTETGLSLGTPHYMSPEQATGEKAISGRSDIYSLASVLYEMLAGQPPHLGGSAQQIIMKIIAEPVQPVTSIRKSVPPNVAAALAKALEKLPADRFATAKAFAEALGSETFTHSAHPTARAATTPTRSGYGATSRRTLVATGVVAVLASAAAAWGWLRPEPVPPVSRLDLNLGEAARLANSDVVISPDGSMIAFAGVVGGGLSAIYLRRLDGAGEFQRLAGTNSGITPDFSPDSRWIVFRREREGDLAKVSISGGGATTILVSASAFNPHWGANDQIVYTGPPGTFMVPATGGTPVKVPNVQGRHISLLPDASGVLATVNGDVVVQSLATDSATVLVRNGHHPVYAKSGHVLYVSGDNALFALPFDLKNHRATGQPVRVLDRVINSVSSRGFSVSDNGTLVHFDGPLTGQASSSASLLAIVRFDGHIDTLRIRTGRLRDVRFSPNARAIAYVLSTEVTIDGADLYTYDLTSRTNTQLTFGGSNRFPIWSPDGTRIAYSVSDSGGTSRRLVVKAANNSGSDTTLLVAQGDLIPSDWPRNDLILFSQFSPTGQNDLYTLQLSPNATPKPYPSDPGNDVAMTLSPDGKLATFSAEGDIWMRDFPTPRGKWRVTPNGGQHPRWSHDGRFIYFWRPSTPFDTLYRVRVERAPAVVVHAPEVAAALDAYGIANWDLHPDGNRFIVAIPDVAVAASGGAPGTPGAQHHLVVLNWFSELKAKVKPK